MNAIHEGWFSELSTLWPGQCLSLQVDEVLCHEKSKYQDVMVLQTYVPAQMVLFIYLIFNIYSLICNMLFHLIRESFVTLTL